MPLNNICITWSSWGAECHRFHCPECGAGLFELCKRVKATFEATHDVSVWPIIVINGEHIMRWLTYPAVCRCLKSSCFQDEHGNMSSVLLVGVLDFGSGSNKGICNYGLFVPWGLEASLRQSLGSSSCCIPGPLFVWRRCNMLQLATLRRSLENYDSPRFLH